MNGSWQQFDEQPPYRLPVGELVGVIYIDTDHDEFVASGAGDDSLHATLCRLAGLPGPPVHKQPPVRPARSQPTPALRVSADVPQLAADLAEEYSQLAASISG